MRWFVTEDSDDIRAPIHKVVGMLLHIARPSCTATLGQDVRVRGPRLEVLFKAVLWLPET